MTPKEKTLRAYELLATDRIDLHMEGLRLLDEARNENFEEVWRLENEIDQHKRLLITAKDPKTEIWVADAEGNHVQKEVGVMETSLKPGSYMVRFGLHNADRKFDLINDTEISE